MIVRKAEEKDLLLIQKLIAKAGLREDGIEQHIDSFLVVVDENDQLIGTVGLERYDTDALLRSLVLDSNSWTARLTLEFLQVALSYAEDQKIKRVFLCSKETNALFQQLGFIRMLEEDVPHTIKQSSHFQRNIKKETKVWSCLL